MLKSPKTGLTVKTTVKAIAAAMLGLGMLPMVTTAQATGRPAASVDRPSSSASSARLPIPPKKGVYRTSRGGGTRSCSSPMGRLVPTRLISTSTPGEAAVEPGALDMATTGGFTTLSRPSFWAYIPYGGGELKSLLFELQDDASGEVYYVTPLQLPQEPGIVEIQLPEQSPELSPERTYRWYLTAAIACKGRAAKASLDGGWIQRYETDADFVEQLTSTAQVYEFYRDNGFWFDALRLLGNQLQQQPDTPGVEQEWANLLELYGLKDWVEQRLSPCCAVDDVGSMAGQLDEATLRQ